MKIFCFKNHRKDTVDAYNKAMSQFLKAFPTQNPEDISKEDILNWRKGKLKSVKVTTWNNLCRHLHAIYKFGIEQGYLSNTHNPFKGLSLRTGKLPKKTLRKELQIQLERILNSEENLPRILQPLWFYSALIKTFKYTVIRRRQLLNLKIADVDLERNELCLTPDYNKNHDYHEIPIEDKLVADLSFLLREHRKRGSSLEAQLFNVNLFCPATRRKGLNMSDDQLSHIFRVLSDLVYGKVSPHRFRHTAATALMACKAENVYVVQQLLGHKNISVTLSYIEYDPEMIRERINSI